MGLYTLHFTLLMFSVSQVDPFGPPALALPLNNGAAPKQIADKPGTPQAQQAS